jgi:hypothetical protein
LAPSKCPSKWLIKIKLLSHKKNYVPQFLKQRDINSYYRLAVFLAVVFGSSPTPSPVSKLDRRDAGRLRRRDNWLAGEWERGIVEEPNHTTARKQGLL